MNKILLLVALLVAGCDARPHPTDCRFYRNAVTYIEQCQRDTRCMLTSKDYANLGWYSKQVKRCEEVGR